MNYMILSKRATDPETFIWLVFGVTITNDPVCHWGWGTGSCLLHAKFQTRRKYVAQLVEKRNISREKCNLHWFDLMSVKLCLYWGRRSLWLFEHHWQWGFSSCSLAKISVWMSCANCYCSTSSFLGKEKGSSTDFPSFKAAQNTCKNTIDLFKALP